MILQPLLSIFVLTTTPTFCRKDPYDPGDDTHIDYLQHKFYDLYFYNYNESLLESIQLTNNPDALIQGNVSDTDDFPEFRIDLDWEFEFYGHKHNWIAISPNGFLTTHPVSCRTFCNWRTSVNNYRRYISPIMSDFNPSAHDDSEVLYLIDNDEQSITVQWHNVTLWAPSDTDWRFNFQVKLLSDGTVYMFYFKVPFLPNAHRIPGYSTPFTGYINYTLHYGLEDAAYQHRDNGVYYLTPYAPVEFNKSHITNRNTIMMKPRRTCLDQLTCEDCGAFLNEPGNSELECGWCPLLGVCSDGLGREIYEYSSNDYCTDNEMIDGDELGNSECEELDIIIKPCRINDHVLAKDPLEEMQTGNSKYYSAVIVDFNRNLNQYYVRYDAAYLGKKNVGYEHVHPCSTVSYDYHTYDLPAICEPHCAPLDPKKDEDAAASTLVVVSVIVVIVIILFTCTFGLFFFRRSRRFHIIESDNITMGAMGIELGDIEDDELRIARGQTPDYNDDNISDLGLHHMGQYRKEEHSVRVSPAPIISPAIEHFTMKSKLFLDNVNVNNNSDNGESGVELGDVNYENRENDEYMENEQPEGPDNQLNNPKSIVEKGYDMTPLGPD